MGGEDADDRRPRRRWRGGRLLLTLAVLLVAGLVTWSLVGGGGLDDDVDDARVTDADGPSPTDVALLGPDLTEAGVRLDDDGEPPSRALGMLRTHLAEVDAQDRTAHITLTTPSRGMELARFAVLWCDMPPEATRGIEVPHGTITLPDAELQVPCAGRDGTPPVRGMVALPLDGTAILEVTGDLPSAGSATLAIYTEPTDGAPTPLLPTSDLPPPPVPPDAVALDDEDTVPHFFGSVRSRLVQIGPDSQIRVHAAHGGAVTVQVDGIAVTDDGDLEAESRWYELLVDPDSDVSALDDAVEDLWRTQEPDLRRGRWIVYVPGSQRTFPVPAALRPAEGERRTVAVSVTVEGEPAGIPQVVVTDAVEVPPDDVADLEPVPLGTLGDQAPTHLQGMRLAAAWTVPQDGLLRALPALPGTGDEPPRLVGTWPGAPSGSIETSATPTLPGVVISHDGLIPLEIVDTSHASISYVDLQFSSPSWSFPVQDRWDLPRGQRGVVLPPVPGLAAATVLAYVPVPFEEFDFTDAPAPGNSWPSSEPGPPWSAPRLLDTVTEADLQDGALTLELGRDAEALWITTHGPGRMELLRDGEPLPWESADGWWSSWTDQAVTTEVPFEPRPGTLQLRVEGYAEGFRIEVRGQG